jgi:hypothetical protein
MNRVENATNSPRCIDWEVFLVRFARAIDVRNDASVVSKHGLSERHSCCPLEWISPGRQHDPERPKPLNVPWRVFDGREQSDWLMAHHTERRFVPFGGQSWWHREATGCFNACRSRMMSSVRSAARSQLERRNDSCSTSVSLHKNNTRKTAQIVGLAARGLCVFA